MNTPARKPPREREPLVGLITVQSLYLISSAVGVAAFALFRLLEPLVRLALTALGLLSLLMAVFYRLASSPPRSPFWVLLGFGLLCGLVLLLYEHLLLFLSKGLSRR